jgi:hypothetical protein
MHGFLTIFKPPIYTKRLACPVPIRFVSATPVLNTPLMKNLNAQSFEFFLTNYCDERSCKMS